MEQKDEPSQGQWEGPAVSRVRADNAGNVLLNVEDVSLAFGGVKALQQVSFDVYEHEIRAIIGPNGAGKSSMLNVINGVYTPQHGRITFLGKVRENMDTHEAAADGIARTFQSLALFKGMSVLDNIMTGRNLRMKTGVRCCRQCILARPRRKNFGTANTSSTLSIFSRFRRIARPSRAPAIRLQKRVDLGRALAMEPSCSARRADGRHEPRREGHVPLRAGCERRIRHNDRFDRTRHGCAMDISDESLCSTARRSAMVRRMKYETARGHRRVSGRRATDDMRTYLLRNWAVGADHRDSDRHGDSARRWLSAPGFYFEVMLGGLMSGVLYSLVALGLVLIFKASGVFNFAQGAMVLFAALSVARMSEVMPLPVAFVLAIGVMAIFAWLIERLVLRHLVNQDAVVLLMATLGVSFFLDGFGQTVWGSDIYQDRHRPAKDTGTGRREHLSGRHSDQHRRPCRRRGRGAGDCVGAVLSKRRQGVACSADDHQAAQSIGIPLNRIWVIVWTVAGFVALVAGVWGSKLGVQFSVSLVALKALPVVILGGFTSVPGAILGGLIIGRGKNSPKCFSARSWSSS